MSKSASLEAAWLDPEQATEGERICIGRGMTAEPCTKWSKGREGAPRQQQNPEKCGSAERARSKNLKHEADRGSGHGRPPRRPGSG